MTATTITAATATTGQATTAGNDGTLVLQTGPAGSPVNALTLDASGNATFVGSMLGNLSLINLGSASSDVSLLIGQTGYIDYTAQTSQALHVATADNQAYEMIIMAAGNGNTAAVTTLSPNNTTYTNFFATEGAGDSGGSVIGYGQYNNAFVLSVSHDIRQGRYFISTKTTSKVVSAHVAGVNTLNLYWVNFICAWQAVASSIGAGDTTTVWTSLGTITFPIASTGRVLIKRVA